ncbi:MAG TPA: hypothetical protein VF234_00420 [Limnochordia bacterium]
MRLSDAEQQLLLDEIPLFAREARSEEMQAQYQALLNEVRAGEVPDALLPLLERIVGLGLETGRIRRVHTAHGEMAALRLFSRLPAGQALQRQAEAANKALAPLQGQPIEEVRFAARGPGEHTLTLATPQYRISLVIDRDGVRVHNIEVLG